MTKSEEKINPLKGYEQMILATIRKMSLSARVSLTLITTLCIAVGGIHLYVSSASKKNIVDASTDQAKQAINQYKQLRGYYTENVVKKVKAGSDLKVSFHHKDIDKTIPLPATMIHDLSKQFSSSQDGMKLKLYSDFPFPNRSSRKLDHFARDAIKYLNDNPGKTFSRTESIDGTQYVRVAIADLMVAEACVTCHNTRSDTPKNDWKLGDVRGVLEVDNPIGNQLNATSSLSKNITFIVGVSVFLAWLAMYFILRWTSKELTSAATSLDRRASSISQSSLQLNETSNSLSKSSQEQAESVQENVAAMSQVTAMVDRTNSQSKVAADKAKETLSKASEGNQIMDEVVDTMSSIKSVTDQLKKTSEVISTIKSKTQVINEIVFKTQLLSVNASIEAARAGEHGKGFAVVADEVGKLAETSGAAANEIGQLIEGSRIQVEGFVSITNDRVTKGENITRQAKEIFDSISKEIESIQELAKDVSHANEEQKEGIHRISIALAQIDRTTQENTNDANMVNDLSNELKVYSQALKSVAHTIKSLISGSDQVSFSTSEAHESVSDDTKDSPRINLVSETEENSDKSLQ